VGPVVTIGIALPPARPRVVVHVATSLDGATTGFEPDVDRFYRLIGTWEEDATLVGADTILAQERALAAAPRPGAAADAPLLAVVDARRRVSSWEALRDCGHWRGVVALRADRSDRPPGAARELVAGRERVDLGAALRMLRRDEGVRTVRVDSGGGLIGALLDAGLVDELSLLVHPVLAGRGERRWHGAGGPPGEKVRPIGVESFDDGVTWMRYALSARAGRGGPAGVGARPTAAVATLSRR
jgi:2,5-diamino-6-(ribosylamino)-4(3H)-pyrimidinone 5'-phosphate reductase